MIRLYHCSRQRIRNSCEKKNAELIWPGWCFFMRFLQYRLGRFLKDVKCHVPSSWRASCGSSLVSESAFAPGSYSGKQRGGVCQAHSHWRETPSFGRQGSTCRRMFRFAGALKSKRDAWRKTLKRLKRGSFAYFFPLYDLVSCVVGL